MLDGIQKAGGIGALKKVDRTQIRDRSAATVGGASADTGPHGSGLPPAGVAPGGGGGGMADALAAALQKRKERVRDSGTFLFFLVVLVKRWEEVLTCCQMTKRVTTSGRATLAGFMRKLRAWPRSRSWIGIGEDEVKTEKYEHEYELRMCMRPEVRQQRRKTIQ